MRSNGSSARWRRAYTRAVPGHRCCCRSACWNGIAVLPFQDRITRLVGDWAAMGPAAFVVAHVRPAGTPVRPQDASQLGVAATVTLPYVSSPRLLAVTRPVQPLLGL